MKFDLIPIWLALLCILVIFGAFARIRFLKLLFKVKALKWAKHKKQEVKPEAEWVYRIAFLLVLGVGIGEFIKRGYPILSSHYSLFTVVGLLLTLLALLMAVAALDAGKQYIWLFQVVPPKENLTDFVREGIYSIVRFPNELIFIVLIAGLSLAFTAMFALVMTVIFLIPASMFRTASKDRIMLEKFGKPYADYAGKTKKLIPFVW